MDDDGTTGGTEGGEYGYCQCSWRSFCWQHNVDCWPCTSVWSAGFQAGTAAAAAEEAEKDARAQALIWDEWEQEWETEEKKAAKKAEKKAAKKKSKKEAKKKFSTGSSGSLLEASKKHLCASGALLDQWDQEKKAEEKANRRAAKKAEKKRVKEAEKEAKKKSSSGSSGGCEAEALLDHQWDRQVQKTKGCNAEVKRAKC